MSRAAGSSNGRTTDFGSVYHGSNPCPAALDMSRPCPAKRGKVGRKTLDLTIMVRIHVPQPIKRWLNAIFFIRCNDLVYFES